MESENVGEKLSITKLSRHTANRLYMEQQVSTYLGISLFVPLHGHLEVFSLTEVARKA